MTNQRPLTLTFRNLINSVQNSVVQVSKHIFGTQIIYLEKETRAFPVYPALFIALPASWLSFVSGFFEVAMR